MSKRPSRKFRWIDRAGGVYWELYKRGEGCVAEVCFDDRSGRWSWYFGLRSDWATGGAPTGRARSLDTAKAICEAIGDATDEDDEN